MFNRLRDFYRPPENVENLLPVEINPLVERAVALTRPRWHGQALGQGVTIDVRCELAPALPELLADAAELRELLTNLIFNAVDALPQGGRITLRTALQEPGPGEGGERALLLEVADTGVGMSEETRRRCLEPFFTTKGTRGTGLGLAMVYGTVQRHGGTIALHSAPGAGTRFVLRLPLRQPAPGPAAVPGGTDEQGSRRILVVDDQAVLCEILVEYLTSDGHEVETALDGYEALEKFRAASAHGEGFDLLITDRAMPGMNGEGLATGVKALEPCTRVILLTGYAAVGSGDECPPCIDLVVDKPVTRAALRQAVIDVMANGSVAARTGRRVLVDSEKMAAATAL